MQHSPALRSGARPAPSRSRSAAVAAGLTATALVAGTAVLAAATAPAAHADESPGIHVDDGRIVEADGTDLVLRGVNHAHTWFTSETSSIADIKAAGANSVRVVLSSGDQWTRNTPEDVANVVGLCEENHLICILEVHDTTGYGDEYAPDAGTLDQAVDYWEDLYPTLAGTEDYVMVNIGNEPMGNDDATNATWADATSDAIVRLRDIGYEHAIVVDAPNWGQDWKNYVRPAAADVFASDPDANTVFSIHMYSVYAQHETVTDYLEFFVDAGLPIMIGEFGWQQTSADVDEDWVLSEAERLNLGWLAWSWSGNTDPYLDLVLDFDPANPSAWGTRIIDGPDGLRDTVVEATWFGGGTDPTDPPTDPTDPSEDATCTATVHVVGTWPSGWQGEVTVVAGEHPVAGWEVAFALPAGATVTNLWGGDVAASGDDVTVTNAAWNGTLGTGASTTIGFLGSGSAPTAAPTAACTAG